MNDIKEKKAQELSGEVVSNKMDKTVVVRVTSFRKHPKYQKYVRASKNYKAHDADNAYQEGDKVMIRASRAYSKDKKWEVVDVIKKSE